jgi:hypothetical protein
MEKDKTPYLGVPLHLVPVRVLNYYKDYVLEKKKMPPQNAKNILYDLRQFGFIKKSNRMDLTGWTDEEKHEHHKAKRREKMREIRERERALVTRRGKED